MGRLFGTDGVRGIANADLTGELAYRLGRAGVIALTDHGEERPSLLVGRDTRGSGEFLEAAFVAGVCSAGGDAILLGIIPTPGVAFLTAELGAQAGVVISASHNPEQYNGIKLFASSGFKLPDEIEDEIEAITGSDEGPRPTGRGVGRVVTESSATEGYLKHLESTAEARIDGMRVVVDCANGAAFRMAPEVLRRLGAEVMAIHDEPDGWNINDGSGATRPEVVALAVLEAGADAGVALDGDADRAIFADHLGRVIDGDHVLAASALDLFGRAKLDRDAVVSTVMANLGFRRRMNEAGIQVIETSVGDRYVLEAMLREGAVLGGEQSGHVIFLNHATTGDGLLTAIQFLSLACRKGTTLAELASTMEKLPQVLVNVEIPPGAELDGVDRLEQAVKAAQADLGDTGRVLVRPSGTEPLARVMVEARTEDEARRHAESIAAAIQAGLLGSAT